MAQHCASTVADIGGLIAACATLGLLIAAVFAGRIANKQVESLKEGLAVQRQIERRRRVYEHLGRLFDGQFILMLTQAEMLFKDEPSENAGNWEALWEERDSVQQSEIMAALDFFEIVAGEYNDPTETTLDKGVADRGLSIIADDMWLKARSFVLWLRVWYPDKRAFREWEHMYERPREVPLAPSKAKP
jgi:hypothetical protein